MHHAGHLAGVHFPHVAQTERVLIFHWRMPVRHGFILSRCALWRILSALVVEAQMLERRARVVAILELQHVYTFKEIGRCRKFSSDCLRLVRLMIDRLLLPLASQHLSENSWHNTSAWLHPRSSMLWHRSWVNGTLSGAFICACESVCVYLFGVRGDRHFLSCSCFLLLALGPLQIYRCIWSPICFCYLVSEDAL